SSLSAQRVQPSTLFIIELNRFIAVHHGSPSTIRGTISKISVLHVSLGIRDTKLCNRMYREMEIQLYCTSCVPISTLERHAAVGSITVCETLSARREEGCKPLALPIFTEFIDDREWLFVEFIKTCSCDYSCFYVKSEIHA